MRYLMPPVLIVLFFLFLSAPGTCQNVLFEEHFTDGSSALTWLAGFGGDTLKPQMMFDNPSGDWWVGRLNNQASGGGVGLSFAGTPHLADYSLEAWVYCPVGPSEYHGIQMRIDSSANAGYQLLADFDADKRLRFRYAVSASPYVIHDFAEAEIPGGVPAESGWHKMKMKAVGFHFWLYWDDQELPGCPYLDASGESGFFGFYVWNFMGPADTYCDDIVVRNEASTGMEGPADTAPDRPGAFALGQNYPNPFNLHTRIPYRVVSSGLVELTVYDVLGQKVRTLVRKEQPPGDYYVSWDGRDERGEEMPTGLYLFVLKVEEARRARKMILMR